MAFVVPSRFAWRLRRRTLALGERTLVMAIVNLTADSFSGDGHLRGHGGANRKLAVAAAVKALEDGADILDVGAESTRPDALPLSADEEQERLLPVLEAVLQECPEAVVSVDTYHAATARAAALSGAEIVNDVSGLTWDPGMAAAVATTGCGLVLMHTRGRPREWAAQTPLPDTEVVPSVFAGLMERLLLAESAGIHANRIVVDPGFGFGKRGRENFALLHGMGRLHQLGRPLLVGLSRKGFLREAVKLAPGERLDPVPFRVAGTTAANVAAVMAGAHVVRVHDVAAAREAVAVADAILSADSDGPFASASPRAS